MFEYKIYKESFIIIVISMIVGFTFNIFNQKGYIFISKSDEKLKKIVKITSREGLIKFKSNSAIFIDARDSDDYKISHIKGAINLLVDDEKLSYSDKKFNIPELNEPKEKVIYCGGASCGLSGELAQKFIELGYDDHIYILKNGFPEWENFKFPIEVLN